MLLISTILAPMWHCPLNVAEGSTCSLPAYKFPVTIDSPRNCKSSFVRILPETLPTISAWLPLMSPSTTPLAPITIFAELVMLPMIVPSIRRSLLLLMSPLIVVPVLMSVVPLPEVVVFSGCISVLFLVLNIGLLISRLILLLSVPQFW